MKRSPAHKAEGTAAPALRPAPAADDPDAEGLAFQEPFEDEFEEEDIVEGDADMAGEDDAGEEAEEERQPQVAYYRPEPGQPGEEMEHDPTAYGMLHRMRFAWPALSFDFLVDQLGQNRTRYPASCFLVAGTQAEKAGDNAVNVIRLAQLGRTKVSDAMDDDAIEDEPEEEVDPTCEHRSLPHTGSVNRIRAMKQRPSLVATWAETGLVHVYDLAKPLSTLGYPCDSAGAWSVSTLSGHKAEGYALDWSPAHVGRLATGDCASGIIVWDASVNAKESLKFTGHNGSVEDLQWSPNEANVFASCSCDGTVRIWDTRSTKPGGMLTERAHDQDVNVISWNAKVEHLLASASDDASFKVWDLRMFGKAQPVGWFHGFHQGPICSIEWSPHDESVLVCASEDHQVSIWDLALEEDREFARAGGMAEDVVDASGRSVVFPPQLLFVHAGIADPKEARFHPQVVGLVGVTGEEGFDVFVCESLDPLSKALEG